MRFDALIIRSLFLLALAAPAAYSQPQRGCPDGQAIRGIDFASRSLICVPVVAPEALNAEIAARNSGDAASVLEAKNYSDAKIAEARSAKVVNVHCGDGESIGAAMRAEDDKQPLQLRIQGNCAEHVVIKRDDLTLQGDGGGASITGSVEVNTGRRVVIADLSVTNTSGDGVTVVNGASATIRSSQVLSNAGYGVSVRNASFALVEDSVLSHNGRLNREASGIFVGTGSMARGLRNTMEGNANAGIDVGDNSTYRSEGDTVSSLPGGRVSLDVYRASLADVRGVTAFGNVDVNQQSQFQVRNVAGFVGSRIDGNINVGLQSFMRLRTGVAYAGSRCGINPPSTGPAFITNSGNFSACQID